MSAPLVALRRRREQVIEALCDGYATDLLPEEEFEHRLDLAHRASEIEALEKLVADIEVADKPKTEPVTRALVPIDRASKKSIVAIMGGASRKGEWTPPERLNIYTLMGGAEIDLREARLPPGTTEINIYTIMGGTEIIVPPNLAVECDGVAIMGGFETLERSPDEPDPDIPRLKITGFCLMGGFEISTRLPGESAREARKRLKKERKAKAKLLSS
jgi:hypothetical protein